MTTTAQRPQHSKPRTRTPKISNVVYLRHPENGRVLTLNANEAQFIDRLQKAGYVKQGKPVYD